MTVPVNKGEPEEDQGSLQSSVSPSPSPSASAPPFPEQPSATENSFLTQNEEEFQTYFDNEKIHIPESENVRITEVYLNLSYFVGVVTQIRNNLKPSCP